MPDEPKKSKTPVAVIAVVLLLCVVAAAWLVLKSRRAQTPIVPPIAALRLESIDETNRVAILSDGGSHAADGTLQSWRIAWGDSKEENFSTSPQKAAHTYGAEGEYTISLWCVDNLGTTSSPPAMTNITFDFLKRQKALEAAQAEAKREAEAQREADRLKEEEARKQAERLEQAKKMELAAQEARKAKEQQELEDRRRAEAELARQKAKEAATPAPTPLAAALPDNASSRKVIYTPPGRTLGEFQISKAKTEGKAADGNLLVILAIRCVNFPDTPIPAADWQIDGKDTHVHAARIRASLSPGSHSITAVLTQNFPSQPAELKTDITVEATGD